MKIFIYSLTSFLLCLLSGLAWMLLAPRLGLMDIPGGRRQHQDSVPKVGGLALMTTLLIRSAWQGFRFLMSPLEFFSILAMALIGLIDDRFYLRPRFKAGLGFVLALALALSTTRHLFPGLAPFSLLGLTIPPTPWLVFLLLGFMYLCIPQAQNLIDGANGLSTGFALVVTSCMWAAGDPHPFLAGALLACLILNWPKARIFLGDCGSLSIGLMLAINAQKSFLLPYPNHILWLFAYPTIDVITVTIIRLIQVKPIFHGDRNHLHFQLRDRWPEQSHLVVPVLLSLAALCGSELFTTGPWRVLPYLGLSVLCCLSGFFIAINARTATSATGDSEGPMAAETAVPANPGLKDMSRQTPVFEGRADASALDNGSVHVGLLTQIQELEIAHRPKIDGVPNLGVRMEDLGAGGH